MPGRQGSGSADHGHDKPPLLPELCPEVLADHGLDHRPNQLPGTGSGSPRSTAVLEPDWEMVFVLPPLD